MADLSLELTHGQLRLLLVELDVRASYAQYQGQAITRLEQQLAEKDAEIAALKKGLATTPRMECPGCKQLRDDVTFAEDPYASEIGDDHEPVWQCGECSHQSAMDI